MKFSAFFILAVGAYVVSADHGWSYDVVGDSGPDFWGSLRMDKNECGKQAQSPIDIDTMRTKYDSGLKPLKLKNYESRTSNVTIINNGHSVQLNSPSWTQTVSGGPLDGTYNLLQMHFHWGKDSYRGSEHTVNGKRYPIELHLVHTKNGDASKLAVIGVFFELTKGDSNIGIQQITQSIKDMETHAVLDCPSEFTVNSLVPNTNDYFAYRGSLTTPPCSEIVQWIVLKDVLKINEKQLELFRSTRFEDKKNMVDNFRPVQGVNAREVRSSFVTSSSSTSGLTMSSLPLMIMSALFCNH